MGYDDDRDYADLQNDKIAVYNFRGYTVLRFHKEKKYLEFGEYAYMCAFVDYDFTLMCHFLEQCYLFTTGMIDKIDHVSVD
jgi:hypothetical protein